MSMYAYLEREQEREIEADWEESEPTDCMTRAEWLAELEAERIAHAESRMYFWIKGGAL